MAKEMTFPKIIVFHEKHRESYFLATCKDDIDKIFFKVIKENNDSGEYVDYKFTGEMKHSKPDFTKDEVDLLPESMKLEKTEMYRKLMSYKNNESISSQAEHIWKTIQKITKENTVKGCYEFYRYYLLEDEYSRFSIESPENF